MGANSHIEWTDHTFNPWIGCTKVSAACDHCYAETLSKARLGVPWGAGQPRRRTTVSNWAQPARWNRKLEGTGRRERVFCASLADVWDTEVPEEWRHDLFRLIEATPNLDWLLLTKRPKVAADRLTDPAWWAAVRGAVPAGGNLRNVWAGTTVEDQKMADARIPHVLATPAAVRFLSCEPLLGPVDLTVDGLSCVDCAYCADGSAIEWDTGANGCRRCDGTGKGDELAIDWVIVGGESGQGARPMHPDWARLLRDQCTAEGVPFHFKQWGEWHPCEVTDGAWYPMPGHLPFDSWSAPVYDQDSHHGWNWRRIGKKKAGRTLDGRTWDQIPEVRHG